MKVAGLSKQFRLGETMSMDSLRDVVAMSAGKLTGRTKAEPASPTQSSPESASEKFLWAVRDVSFEVKQGECLGIIGHNGAGKSTLLKLISRITEPTSGAMAYKGRLAALLEVGTGFHPELTGRENIFLNGSILGMTRKEIKSKIGDIVEFAGVEKFLDTPVKRYSSGMQVRLGFSVAAHLDPDILVVDEVLAVGDAAFQARCIEKMSEATKHGRTVLVVSHQLNIVKRLTSRCLIMNNGWLDGIEPTGKAIHRYMNGLYKKSRTNIEDYPYPISSITVNNQNALESEAVVVVTGQKIVIAIQAMLGEKICYGVQCAVHIDSVDGVRVQSFTTRNSTIGQLDTSGKLGYELQVDELLLVPGNYVMLLNFRSQSERWVVDFGVTELLVVEEEGKTIPTLIQGSQGYCNLRHAWISTRK